MYVLQSTTAIVKGFRELIEMDWVEFGHKFADRNGVVNGDANERAPVFLQWLDGVHQVVEQNPLAFEVSSILQLYTKCLLVQPKSARNSMLATVCLADRAQYCTCEAN